MVIFIDIDWWLLCAGGGGGGEGGNGELFNGNRISVLQNEKNSGDWLPNSMDVLATTELYTRKWLG